MRAAPAAAILFAFMSSAAHGAPPGIEPGVSLELARWRAAHYRDVRYSLELKLSAGAPTVRGFLELRVDIPRPASDLVLDWRPQDPAARLSDLSVNGEAPAAAREWNEHLVIPRERLRAGENVVRVRFESPVAESGRALTRYRDREDGSEYLYSLFVPSDASTVFPCFDQPDLKGRFRLEVEAPPDWKVVSNAPERHTRQEGGFTRHIFDETPPISTYLFAFAAGPFEIHAAGAMRLYARRSRQERAAREAQEVLQLNSAAIAWLERYFGARFPFAKYDLVLVPEFAYGGMEHAGATFLREEAVLFPSEPNDNDRLRRAQLVFHEASHQWFGNFLTMRWFDDLWLKEGFANFMAAKLAAALVPQYHPWSAFQLLKASAYRTDATRGTTPIYHAIANLSEAKSAYGSIVYGKAPAILRQAEYYLGEKVFQKALRRLLKARPYGVTDWRGLLRSLERASGRSLERWADAWVKRRGMPRVRLAWKSGGRGAVASVVLEQEDVLGGRGLWPMRVQAGIFGEAGEKLLPVTLRGRRAAVPGAAGAREALFLFANCGDYGYGQFLLDERSRAAVLARPALVRGELLRALVFDSLWESVREAELDPLAYIDFVIAAAPGERDEVTLAALLGRLRTAFLRYLPAARRERAADRVERFLAQNMQSAPSAGVRITFFRALADSAWSETGRAMLKDLLAGAAVIPQVRLAPRDRFRVIRTLLARGDPDAAALFASQVQADASDDGRRYAYGAAAARPDPNAKAQYFAQFVAGRGVAESWIEEALGPFNDIGQAELSLPFLERALQVLPRLQRERKIFFVNNWLAAFIGGQTGREALEQVERYLASGAPDDELRLKVLEALDVLERTVKIRTRFPD